MLQAFLASFTYSQRSEAILTKGREALLRFCEEKEKLVAELREASSRANLSTKIMELSKESLK